MARPSVHPSTANPTEHPAASPLPQLLPPWRRHPGGTNPTSPKPAAWEPCPAVAEGLRNPSNSSAHSYILTACNSWRNSARTEHICHSPSMAPCPRSISSECVACGSADIKSERNRTVAALSTKSLPKATLRTLLIQFSEDPSLGCHIWSWVRAAGHQSHGNKPSKLPLCQCLGG